MQDTVNTAIGRWSAILARADQFKQKCAAEDKLRAQVEAAQAVADPREPAESC